jgi:hypothetical protein
MFSSHFTYMLSALSPQVRQRRTFVSEMFHGDATAWKGGCEMNSRQERMASLAKYDVFEVFIGDGEDGCLHK